MPKAGEKELSKEREAITEEEEKAKDETRELVPVTIDSLLQVDFLILKYAPYFTQ